MKTDIPRELIFKVLCAECNDDIEFKGISLYRHTDSDEYHYPLCDECWEWIYEEQEKDPNFKPNFVIENNEEGGEADG